MLHIGLRSAVRGAAIKVLDQVEAWLDDGEEPEVVTPAPAPDFGGPAKSAAEPAAAAPVEPAPVEAAPVEPAPVEAAPAEPAPIEAAPAEPAPVEAAPVEAAWDRDHVEAILDDLVRPALNDDGGDVQLVNILGNDVYLRLVGACGSCPSSTLTMKMGIERILAEELPNLGKVIQVESAF